MIALFVANAGLFLHFELHPLPLALAILQLNDSVIQTLRAGCHQHFFDHVAVCVVGGNHRRAQ